MKKSYPKKRKRQSLSWVLRRSKGLLFISTTLLLVLLIIQATYAWETYSDEVENKFGSTEFSASLKELFTPNKEWEPGRTTLKEVYVLNDGQIPGFIRLKAEEFLINFEMDTEAVGSKEATGNVTTYTKTIPTPTVTIDDQDVFTWKAGDYYKKPATAEILKGISTVPANLQVGDTGLVYELYPGEDLRKKTDLAYLTIDFGDVKNVKPSLTSNYWLYGEDGYFYYSEKLLPGISTSLFIEQTSLSNSTPNRLKNSLYKLNIYMEGMEATKATLSEWGLLPGSPVYEMLKPNARD